MGCTLLSHLSLRELCVLADKPRLLCWWLSPGPGSWEVDFTPCPLGWGILSYSLLLQLTPRSPLCLNLQEPASLGLPFQSRSDAPWHDSMATVALGSVAAGDVSRHRWPEGRDISSNATKGLPDLHSHARPLFLPLSGLFITV